MQILGQYTKILHSPLYALRLLESEVGIATRYGLDGSEIEPRWGGGGARFSAPVQTGPGARPVSYTMGTWSFPGVKRPGHDVKLQPPSSAEINP